MIADLIDCDVHRIDAADPYPASYDATVARNVREQNADVRPVIADPLASIEQYDSVLLGSPIWNVRPPMIMTTFTENHDFTGKTVHPFVTYAVSGLGSTERDYTAYCPGAANRPRPGGAGRRGDPAPHRRRDLASRCRITHHLNVRLTHHLNVRLTRWSARTLLHEATTTP
jgi:hypothetical protein